MIEWLGSLVASLESFGQALRPFSELISGGAIVLVSYMLYRLERQRNRADFYVDDVVENASAVRAPAPYVRIGASGNSASGYKVLELTIQNHGLLESEVSEIEARFRAKFFSLPWKETLPMVEFAKNEDGSETNLCVTTDESVSIPPGGEAEVMVELPLDEAANRDTLKTIKAKPIVGIGRTHRIALEDLWIAITVGASEGVLGVLSKIYWRVSQWHRRITGRRIPGSDGSEESE